MGKIIAWIAISLGMFISVRFVLPFLAGLLLRAGFTRINYRGEAIPTSAGLIFLLVTPIWLVAGVLLGLGHYSIANVFILLFALMGMGIVGFLDDVLGTQEDKGFLGHFRALFQGRLTSGALKALYGGVVAALVSVGLVLTEGNLQKGSFVMVLISFLLNTALIGLSTNLINLLDLRPGRAGKAFFIGLVTIFFLSRHPEMVGLALPIAIGVLAYISHDLKAHLMMGDAGSNLLGGILGLMMAWTFTPWAKAISVIILLGLNLLSEIISFSALIERSRILRFLDQIGRGRPE